jgi:hypothetical protein
MNAADLETPSPPAEADRVDNQCPYEIDHDRSMNSLRTRLKGDSFGSEK